jgi:hypothetical protein
MLQFSTVQCTLLCGRMLRDSSAQYGVCCCVGRMLRDSSAQYGLSDFDQGPNELSFQLSEHELQTHQQQEINKLREKLEQAYSEIEAYKVITVVE